MSDRKHKLERELNRLSGIIKEKYNPEKIILFGSLATRKINDWSDIDLVIIKKTDKTFFERLKELFLLLKPKVGIDFLVYTPAEFKELKNRTFFKDEVLKKGKVLYAGR